MLRAALCLTLVATAVSGCVTVVPNTTYCTVSGVMAAGAICAQTRSDQTHKLTLDELIEMLEPQEERPDPKDPSKTLPRRPGAIIQSAEDWLKQKTALETACRRLGKRCSYEAMEAIKGMNRITAQ